MNQSSSSIRRRIYLGLLLLVSATLAVLAVLFPLLEQTLSPALVAGQLADRDYRSTKAIIYESEVLTENMRQAAERAVTPIYTLPDTRLARQQLESLLATLAHISSVRADSYANSSQKLQDLSALEDITLSPDSQETLLGITDARWQEVQKEAIGVLEVIMSTGIRPEDLSGARRRIPSKVSLTIPEAQASVVAELVAAFVVPNSQYSESLTSEARHEAYLAVKPITRSFALGQTIALKGQVLEAEDIEALQHLQLVSSGRNLLELVSSGTLALIFVIFMWLYLSRRQALWNGDLRKVGLIAVLFLGSLFSARLIIPAHTVIPFAFPLATYGLTMAVLFSLELALVTIMPLVILTAVGMPNAAELTLYFVVTSMFGVLAIGRARRLANFFWAGVAIAITGSMIVLIYRIPLPDTDMIGLFTLVGAAGFNGLASASLSILLQSILAGFLGSVTPLQLMELTRPDHPLLRTLLQEAPGTYQHSLQVANLAEQCADRVGADPLLTRVGALYHDIGKTNNPFLFIENQPPGTLNPHDELEPEVSAKVIIRHVSDGLELGRKYRLPGKVLDFIAEHHGTMITRYQHSKAVKQAGGDDSFVDIERYRYPGLCPQSLEVALLMLADGCEARVRAERPEGEEELRELMRGLIADRISSGQLDDTELTLRDLNLILESFILTLQSIYHPRLIYPQIAILPEALEESATVNPVVSLNILNDNDPIEKHLNED